MAKRLENPHADDLGQAGVELNHAEFEEFLDQMRAKGCEEKVIDAMIQGGFFAPITRPGFEDVFKKYRIQADVYILSVCREGRLDAMKQFILLMQADGGWPDIPEEFS